MPGTPSRQSAGIDPPVAIRREEGAQMKWCQNLGVPLKCVPYVRELLGYLKGAKYCFALQDRTWDVS